MAIKTWFCYILQYQDKCVEMYTDERLAGKWGSVQCNSIKGYVCETTRSKLAYRNKIQDARTKINENKSWASCLKALLVEQFV